jgi:hypothetical protein
MNKSTGGGRTDALRREAKRLLPKKRLGDNPRLKLRAEILHEALSASETGAELSRRALASVGEEILQDSPATKGHGNETKAKAGPPAFREAPAERLPHNAAGRAELLRRVQEQGNPPLQDRFTDSKAPVDKYRKTSHNPPDINQPREARGKDEGAMNALNKYLKEIGVTEPVTAEQAARIGAFAKAEVMGRAAPKLSEAALAAFKAHAAANQWNPESEPYVAPSAFIKKTFKKWLKRGLTRKHIEDAQRNLAGAYSTEVSRDSSKRVEGLISARETLPVGAPRPPSGRPVAELSEKAKAERREKKAAAQRRWRKKPHGEAPRLSL